MQQKRLTPSEIQTLMDMGVSYCTYVKYGLTERDIAAMTYDEVAREYVAEGVEADHESYQSLLASLLEEINAVVD